MGYGYNGSPTDSQVVVLYRQVSVRSCFNFAFTTSSNISDPSSPVYISFRQHLPTIPSSPYLLLIFILANSMPDAFLTRTAHYQLPLPLSLCFFLSLFHSIFSHSLLYNSYLYSLHPQQPPTPQKKTVTSVWIAEHYSFYWLFSFIQSFYLRMFLWVLEISPLDVFCL